MYIDREILQRLTLYALAYTMFNPNFRENTKHTKFSDTLDVLHSWDKWDDITVLANHQIVKGYLLESINETHGAYDELDVRLYFEVVCDMQLNP